MARDFVQAFDADTGPDRGGPDLFVGDWRGTEARGAEPKLLARDEVPCPFAGSNDNSAGIDTDDFAVEIGVFSIVGFLPDEESLGHGRAPGRRFGCTLGYSLKR